MFLRFFPRVVTQVQVLLRAPPGDSDLASGSQGPLEGYMDPEDLTHRPQGGPRHLGTEGFLYSQPTGQDPLYCQDALVDRLSPWEFELPGSLEYLPS